MRTHRIEDYLVMVVVNTEICVNRVCDEDIGPRSFQSIDSELTVSCPSLLPLYTANTHKVEKELTN